MANIVLNTEQEEAFNGLKQFILTGNHKDEYATISGKAGTGKTVVLSKLVESLPNRRFIVAAISHKAKEVIASRIKSKNVRAMTVAALLAMKFDPETGEFTEDPFDDDLPIADADIVIIDEASMLHQDSIKYIFKKKLHRTIIIFAGDIGQIRPIRKYSKLNEVSPIFNSPNFFQLLTRVRQGEGNPILADMDYFWDMTRNPKPELKLEEILKENKENEIGKISYRNNMLQTIIDYLPYFKEALDNRNTNLIKIICFKNDNRIFINDLVRKELFNDQDPPELMIGELMIMNDTYSDDLIKVENSTEFAINDFRLATKTINDYDFEYYIVDATCNSFDGESSYPIRIPVLARHEKARFDKYIKMLFAEAGELPRGVERKNKYAEVWSIVRMFAKIDYGYTLSAHKSQGSTYDKVIVNLTDMLKAPTNDQERASLIYTGGTRARNEVVMVNKNFIL